MMDKFGKELKVGDWAILDTRSFGTCLSKVSKIIPPRMEVPTFDHEIAYFFLRKESSPWKRIGSDLIRLDENEAMLWMLENL